MIINRIFKNQSFNWKYAIGEVILIFIGISLSLLFEEWRTNRSKRETEKEHIEVLIESVKHDIVDADRNIQQSKGTLEILTYLVNSLVDNKPFSDSISLAFGYIVHNPQFSADRSGINNIEGTGLNIISDLKLRSEINDYYVRVESNTAWGENVQRHIDEFLSPRVITDFKDFMYIQSGIPFDYEKLRSDRVFINAIKRSLRLNVISVDRLETQKKHAVDFLALLEKSLE
jgi:hypothetical protein